MARQIHDRLSAQIYRAHYFLHLDIVIFTVSGYSQIYVDLGTQHAADSLRIQAGMIPVCADGYFALCYQLHQRLGRHVFFLRNCLNFRCYDSFSCCVHLCCVISHLFLLLPSCGFSSQLRCQIVLSLSPKIVLTTFFLCDRRWCPQSAAMHYYILTAYFLYSFFVHFMPAYFIGLFLFLFSQGVCTH